MATDDFFRARLDGMIDPRHPLVVLATRLPWTAIEASLAPLLARKPSSRTESDLKNSFSSDSPQCGRQGLGGRIPLGFLGGDPASGP